MKTTRSFLYTTILSVIGIFIFFSSCDDDAKRRFELCTVTFDSRGGDFTPTTQETYTSGKIEMPSPSPKKGVDSVLVGWFSDPARTIQFDFASAVESDMVLYAKWRLRTEWVVDFDSKGGSSVEAQFIPLGSVGYATLQDVYPTKINSSFGGWYLDAELTERFDFSTPIDQDYTLYARWVGKNMMFIQGGTFTMGKGGADPSGSGVSPAPEHQVTLNDFIIAVYELGNNDFVTFLNANSIGSDGMFNGKNMLLTNDQNGYTYSDGSWVVKSGFENFPAVTVTWYGAAAYCEWVGGRLPTEAEWEFAARGGNKTKNYTYIGGNDPLQVGWYFTNCPDPKGWVQQRGALTPNELGLYDMPGNSFEWCSDWASEYPSDGAAQTNPSGPEESIWFPNKIMRGAGAWSGPENLMPFYRGLNDPNSSYPTIGLRVLIP